MSSSLVFLTKNLHQYYILHDSAIPPTGLGGNEDKFQRNYINGCCSFDSLRRSKWSSISWSVHFLCWIAPKWIHHRHIFQCRTGKIRYLSHPFYHSLQPTRSNQPPFWRGIWGCQDRGLHQEIFNPADWYILTRDILCLYRGSLPSPKIILSPQVAKFYVEWDPSRAHFRSHRWRTFSPGGSP